MNAYTSRLIAVMIVCRIAAVIAPDSDHARRYIRVVCALTVLLTVLSPLSRLLAASDGIAEKITAFFTADQAVPYEETEAGAVGLMQYVAERYCVSDLSVTIRTDETDTEITGIRFYIPDCPYSTRAAIESDLNGQLAFPVEVFTDREGDVQKNDETETG